MESNGDYSPLSIKLPCKIIDLCLFSFSIFATDSTMIYKSPWKPHHLPMFLVVFQPTNQGVFLFNSTTKWWVTPLKKPHSQVGALDLEASSRWGKGKGRWWGWWCFCCFFVRTLVSKTMKTRNVLKNYFGWIVRELSSNFIELYRHVD